MVDIVDKVTRSRMMAGIKGTDTKPELALRRALHKLGLRYRLHANGLPGRPDLILPKYYAAIQVHGCFWHRHEHCKYATTPSSNVPFWKKKFAKTIERDQRKFTALRHLGWRVAIVWECAIKEQGAVQAARSIQCWLASDEPVCEITSGSAA